jgi:hypothetical protein
MSIEDKLHEFQHRIVKLSRDEDEAADFALLLAQTNWLELFELDKRKMFLCDKCGELFSRKDMVRGGNAQFWGQYCKSCCVRCPVCKIKHVGHPRQWLYPLCQQCVKSVEYSIVHKEQGKLASQLQRARREAVPDTLTLGEWIGTLINFSWMCAYCQTNPYEHCDHFLPIRHGGGTTQSNCVPACQRCNFAKSQYHPSKVKNIPQDAMIRVQNYLHQF